jgi:hypothetical protein
VKLTYTPPCHPRQRHPSLWHLFDVVPSNWLSIVVLLLCFAPGWLAIAGWRRGRSAPGPHRALGDGVPAVALSAAWTGPLALLVGPTFVESWIGASSVGQAALLLVVLAVLLGVPALLGFVTARATRPTASEPVLATAWLCDGTVVHGRARPPSSTVAGTWTFEDAEVIRRGERWRSERVVVPDDRLSALSTATVIAALTAPRLGGRR